jgi:diguanylate cyclase
VNKHGSWSPYGIDHGLASLLAQRTLRASVALSSWQSIGLIFLALAVSWLLVHLAGGAGSMVPHWYYIPILFAATRFGPLAALITAVLAGVIAGPLTFESVAAGSSQDAAKWLTRTAFFVGIGQVTAWLLAPSMRPLGEEVRRMRIEHQVRRALAHQEFFLVYQPIYSNSDCCFTGVEALIRWNHPVRGQLTPAHFMDVIEESDLIHDLTDFVIEQACSQAATWQEQARERGLRPWHVAINLSARDLHRPDLATRISDAIERHGLTPDLVQFELTESVLAMEGTGFTLHQLRRQGIKVAIDDFGTGWSSLSYLNRFPVDLIKIDRSLIAGLSADPSSHGLARGVVALADSLGLTTIAEGLETEEQLQISRELGFDFVQGYLFSKPQAQDRILDTMLQGGPGQGERVVKPLPTPASSRGDGQSKQRS